MLGCNATDFQTQDSDFGSAFEAFFYFDEDEISEDGDKAELPDAVSIVAKGITARVLLRGVGRLNDDGDADVEADNNTLEPQAPIANIDGAIHYTTELSRYLQDLRVTKLHTPSGKGISVARIWQVLQICNRSYSVCKQYFFQKVTF